MEPKSGTEETNLVAAGVVLRRNQDQARPARFSLLLRPVAECPQNADDGGIGGENAEAHGCDDGEEEDDGHQVRDHDRPTLENPRVCCSASPILNLWPERELRSFSNLTALTLRAVDD